MQSALETLKPLVSVFLFSRTDRDNRLVQTHVVAKSYVLGLAEAPCR